MTQITLATEDALSEAVGERLIDEQGAALEIGQRLRRNGSGYLRMRIPNFCAMADLQPVFLITDLDRLPCPSALLSDWIGRRKQPAGFLLRVAVREIESWLLADHEALRRVLARPHERLPNAPDQLEDPKRFLIDLARRGPRRLREAIVPEDGAIAVQGLGYNEVLVDVVRRLWNPSRAAQRSQSLQRARVRLADLANAR